MPIIDARDITKTYPASGGARALLGRGGIGTWLRGGGAKRPALAPLTLTVEPGEALGIIGRNGSGKSTLLKLIAGVTAPTAGTLAVRGRVASLLELGAGFHPMLTGRENVYLNAGLLGMRHAGVDACFDAIVDFSEIGEFIDQTVDTYSSGMYVRLAFSVAIHTDPDVFLVDEVLSVGDESFQRKCRARILELKAAGKTILFVSHDLGTVQTLCDRVMLLDHGQLLSRGSAQDTIDFYLRQIGGESGIHRLHDGDTEVLFNHGRLALYHRQREITAPLGIKVQFFSMGSYHESTAATWTLTRTDTADLEAQGAFSRLPVTLYLRVQIIENRIHVYVTWENHRPIDLDYVAVQCFFPTSYTRWCYGDTGGEFPAIDVTDRQWSNIVPARHNAGPAYLLAAGDSDTPPPRVQGGQGERTPPIAIELDPDATPVPLQFDNTDYMTQARLAHVTEAIPATACPLPPARRQLAAIILDPSQNLDDIAAARALARSNRTLTGGEVSAIMERGALAFFRSSEPLSCGLHLHVQLKIGGLWTLSHALQWGPAIREGDRLTATAGFTRLPCRMRWTLALDGPDFVFHAALDLGGTLEVEEFNVSLELAEAYGRWETPDESGAFETAEFAGEWRHLNQRFAPGGWIRATSPSLPAIALSAASTLGALHPTAIQTGESGRVLQLLCSPGQQATFSLAPGAHPLLEARVTVGAARPE